MLEQIGGLLVQLVMTLLVVKLWSDMQKKKASSQPVVSTGATPTPWKDASALITHLEERIAMLQERDATSQDKIWNLEDQTRLLKLHLSETKRELAAKSIALDDPDAP